MPDLRVELPKEIPAADRAALVRALEASAQVKIGTAQMRDFDAAQTLFVIAATVATIDIIWKWYQAARAKNRLWDVVITELNGDQVHMQDVTLDELKRLVG